MYKLDDRVEVVTIFRLPRASHLSSVQGSKEEREKRTNSTLNERQTPADVAMRQELPVRSASQNVRAAVRSSERSPADLVMPVKMRWGKKEITFSELGLRHPTKKGQRMVHVFDMSDGINDYRLEFDAEMLTWTLTAILSGAGR